MVLGITIAAALLLAAANGANDNFKGVATLWGSGTLNYRYALAWATLTVFAGCLISLALGPALASRFSGKGLVDAALVADPAFLGAVALGAFLTVLTASRLGLPVSTTHALIGGLIGGSVAAHGIAGMRLAPLGRVFVLPSLLSPVIAALLAGLIYRPLRSWRGRSGLDEESCVCLESSPTGHATSPVAPMARMSGVPGEMAIPRGGATDLRATICRLPAAEGAVGVPILGIIEILHVISAGMVGLARGLNDAPKLVALLSVAPALAGAPGLAFIAVAMLVGGLVGSRRVASTLSFRITPMNEGQGFVGSLVTAGLVGAASLFALPVSTTHVTCGAVFGIGVSNGSARWSTIRSIMLAWIGTLPLSALITAASYRGLIFLRTGA